MVNIDQLRCLFEGSIVEHLKTYQKEINEYGYVSFYRHNRIILEYSLLSDSLFNFGDYNEILDCIDKKSLKKIMKKHKFI